MLLMGDEVRRTQQSNNNAYCIDNEGSWFDWDLCKTNAEIFRFVQKMIRLRLHFDQGAEGNPIPLEDYLCNAEIKWHGTTLDKPDWGTDSHSFALELHNHALSQVRYIAINSYWNPLNFQLPPLPTAASRWIRMIDTSLGSPDDIADVGRGSEVMGADYVVSPHSIVVLHYASPDGTKR
jgi:glycogen operon protein